MIVWYTCKAAGIEKEYSRCRPDIAVKAFLNYFRRFREERPAIITVTWRDQDGTVHLREALAEWYTGPCEADGMAKGAVGTWWRFKGWKEQQSP
jgi:hypothetical protein